MEFGNRDSGLGKRNGGIGGNKNLEESNNWNRPKVYFNKIYKNKESIINNWVIEIISIQNK